MLGRAIRKPSKGYKIIFFILGEAYNLKACYAEIIGTTEMRFDEKIRHIHNFIERFIDLQNANHTSPPLIF